MTDIQDIPVNFLLRPEFETMRDAAQKDGKCDGKTPFEYLKGVYQDNRYTTEAQRLGTVAGDGTALAIGWLGGGAAGMLVSTAAGGPIGLIGSAVMLIDGGRSMQIIVINDTDSDISLTNRHDDCGEQVTRPVRGKSVDCIPRRLAAMPDPQKPGQNLVDAMVWYGAYSFRKATTLGIGFFGTAGALTFASQDGSVLPSGFSIGWDVPEAWGAHNNCAVSVNSDDPKHLYDTWIDSDTKRSVDSSSNATSGVKAYCAMESQKDNPTDGHLVVLLTDETKW